MSLSVFREGNLSRCTLVCTALVRGTCGTQSRGSLSSAGVRSLKGKRELAREDCLTCGWKWSIHRRFLLKLVTLLFSVLMALMGSGLKKGSTHTFTY